MYSEKPVVFKGCSFSYMSETSNSKNKSNLAEIRYYIYVLCKIHTWLAKLSSFVFSLQTDVGGSFKINNRNKFRINPRCLLNMFERQSKLRHFFNGDMPSNNITQNQPKNSCKPADFGQTLQFTCVRDAGFQLSTHTQREDKF